MSSFTLKILAYVTMVIDHVGLLFFPDIELFRIIGRLAFPLFAFFIAEGFIHTRSSKKYLLRLVLFAFLSIIPYAYFVYTAGLNPLQLNILFTLAAGLLLLILWKKKLYTLLIASFLYITIVNGLLPLDYGLYGVFLIIASYILLKKREVGVILFGTLVVINHAIHAVVIGNSRIEIFALLSLIPILSYNGQLGRRLPRWAVYSFYPVHFLILLAIYHLP